MSAALPGEGGRLGGGAPTGTWPIESNSMGPAGSSSSSTSEDVYETSPSEISPQTNGMLGRAEPRCGPAGAWTEEVYETSLTSSSAPAWPAASPLADP